MFVVKPVRAVVLKVGTAFRPVYYTHFPVLSTSRAPILLFSRLYVRRFGLTLDCGDYSPLCFYSC